MRITLAGYNLDADTIDLLKQVIDLHRQGADPTTISDLLDRLAEEPLTPETISAAYARISRSDKGVRELRRDARSSVSRARQSNERIVFGLGHASVSEHAVFNIDVTDASRLALEELEGHRLASYTESSQRYISMAGDFVTPEEIIRAGKAGTFQSLCGKLFDGYRQISERLEEFHQDLPDRDRQGRAREDARYLLPLACRGQVGMTINARSAEWVIQQSTHSNLSEVRDMGNQMAKLLRSLTPSLIKYTDAMSNWKESNEEIFLTFQQKEVLPYLSGDDVSLINEPVHAERVVSAAMGMRVTGTSIESLIDRIECMDDDDISKLIARAHRYLTPHSPVRREFELASFTFSVVVSASAFAQLKRHRIATIISQPYDPRLDITVPPAITNAGMESDFREYILAAGECYEDLLKALPKEDTFAAQYALTNAHRRRVIFHANIREMIHLSRLREDSHAQWDIRQISGRMVALAMKSCPTLMFLASGKDNFELVKSEIERRG